MKKIYDIIFYCIIITLSIVAIYTSGFLTKDIDFRKKELGFERALVTQVVEEQLNPDRTIKGMKLGHQQIEVKILTGEFKDTLHSIRNPMGRLYNIHTQKDMELIVVLYEQDGEIESISVYSYLRNPVIYLLIALFFISLIIIGGIKGVKSIFSLIFTGILVIFFMIPVILRGFSPIGAAVITASLSTAATFYMLSGLHKKTLAAVVGTVLGVSIAGSIAYLAGRAAHLTGVRLEHAESLLYIADETGMQFRGLMFAAILIASLGAMMDVAMSIVSAMAEIKQLKPSLSSKALFRSGMNVGRDIIGTMSNTLILAFSGGLLTNIIILTANKSAFYQFMNLETIAMEMIQALGGSIGIVLSVPVTALVSSILLSDHRLDKR